METESPVDWTDILAGCRDARPGAQRQLYELCRDRVYRLTVRMVGLQDAADVSQQIFLQVFRKIDQFAGNSRFETWLYRLAVNESLQHLRKRKRRALASLEEDPASHGGNDAALGEAKESLERAMELIDPSLKSIFLLRQTEGLSYAEIAEAMGIPAGTVGSRLNRARSELRQHLIAMGWEP